MDKLKEYLTSNDHIWISQYDTMINNEQAEYVLSFDITQQTIPIVDDNTLLFIAKKYAINNSDEIANEIYTKLMETKVFRAAYSLGHYFYNINDNEIAIYYYNK